ncbi:MAG: metal ABC transporter permease [Oscillospiraceae bacterium]|jgi:zinc transport system permease protein|nr:metal ABC transporter permease [Oscillospiraceae bacterium]
MQQLLGLWQMNFFRMALGVGLLLSVCSSLLGVTLVLRRCSMISDGLSHVGFGALAVAAALGWAPLPVALPAVVVAAIFLLRSSKLRGDAAIALLSTSCLALGVLAVALKGGSNTELMNYLFGSLWAVRQSDLWVSLALCAVTLLCFGWFHHRVFSVTFDETFARATGVRTGWFQIFTAALTSLTIVLGMRMLGTMLISSLVIFPALIAMRVCKSFRAVTLCAAVVSVACFLAGFFFSALWKPMGAGRDLPTGATIVAVNVLCFGVFSLIGFLLERRKFRC